MKYRNKRTGAVIDVESQISGKDWEKVEEAKPASSTGRRPRKTRGKQDG